MLKTSWLKNLMLTGLMFCAVAAGAQDLYSTTVPVDSRTTPDRTKALKQALNDVFVKVSGEQVAASHPSLEPAMRQVNNMVSQYRYQQDDPEALLLSVTFDEDAVNFALMEAELAVWDGFRPVNIVWAAVDINGRRYMVTQSEEQPQVAQIREELQRLAAQRGMSIIFPLGDLSDRRAVNASDIWGGFQNRIVKASQRYDSDGIVVAKLTARGPDNYQIDWNTSLGRERDYSYRNNATLTTVLKDPVNSMADISANLYAKAFDQIDQATLIVTELNEVQDYAKVYAYLKQLNTVADVQLVEFAVPNVVFSIKLSGRLASFEKNLSLDGMLMPSVEPELFAESNTVIYRYMP